MPDVIKFYSVREPYGCFSNFSKHKVFIQTTWPTTEHYFQAQKFLDMALQLKIRAAKSPMIAARMGRNRSWPLRPDWDDAKDDIMRTAIRAKVMQHADVRETLLATGDAEIVEHTSNDRYWGDGGDGSGSNMLGRILMEVRAELTKDGPFDELANPLPPPWIKHPETGPAFNRMEDGSWRILPLPSEPAVSRSCRRPEKRRLSGKMYLEPESWREYRTAEE